MTVISIILLILATINIVLSLNNSVAFSCWRLVSSYTMFTIITTTVIINFSISLSILTLLISLTLIFDIYNVNKQLKK